MSFNKYTLAEGKRLDIVTEVQSLDILEDYEEIIIYHLFYLAEFIYRYFPEDYKDYLAFEIINNGRDLMLEERLAVHLIPILVKIIDRDDPEKISVCRNCGKDIDFKEDVFVDNYNVGLVDGCKERIEDNKLGDDEKRFVHSVINNEKVETSIPVKSERNLIILTNSIIENIIGRKINSFYLLVKQYD